MINASTNFQYSSSKTKFKSLKELNKSIGLTLPSIYTQFDTLKKKALENIVEKGEIPQNEQFHLFPKCFLCNLYLKSHYHTIPHFDGVKINICGKHCEKIRNCL